ncbi:MAG: pyruvate, phosphate dikinase [Desulfobacter postgatei]|uniref:Pyruvate, phosphate dikinase n=1 Tax=Desulfobacter postgatei TaxID=2293 RepID=A0A2G6MRM1_9BACT|nr:MAG: pyruvate, phosphate dikinase [Desulfobacter postgatei]
MKSKALEVNLSDTRANVTIDERYSLLLNFFKGYVGIVNRLEIFLKELSHPYRNWSFIVNESRHFSFQHFHLYTTEPDGPKVLALLCDIFNSAFESVSDCEIKSNAADNLMQILHYIAKSGTQGLDLFNGTLIHEIERILAFQDCDFFFFVCSYYQPDTLVKLITQNNALPDDPNLRIVLNKFLIRFFDVSFAFWLCQDDPVVWMKNNIDEWRAGPDILTLLEPVSRQRIKKEQQTLMQIKAMPPDDMNALSALLELTGHRAHVKRYRQIPRQMFSFAPEKIYGKYVKLTFLFYIIHSPGLSFIHREALGDIHRTLITVIGKRGDYKKDMAIVDQTFSLLKEHKGRYPETVLECIHKIGDAVYNTDEIELINHFIDRSVDHGFQFPDISGTGEDWQIQCNVAHVRNIRVFLALVAKHPKKSQRLLSALISSLAVGGVFIRDTDLFPRDITTFLNADIAPVYNLVKQLARLLPTFFNEIGAEGELRDISTRLDESVFRRDRLVHFLRKQSHVESSSRIVDFIQEVIMFWQSLDKTPLKPYLPPSIYDEISTRGKYIDGPHTVFHTLALNKLKTPADFLAAPKADIEAIIDKTESVTDLDRERAKLMIRFHALLNEKYGIENLDLESYVNTHMSQELPDPRNILHALGETELENRIGGLLAYMAELKNIILSKEKFVVNETIYHKRHIAVDIPSMYGSYSEAKFDALGMTLRLESVINVLFEDLINSIDLRLITKPTFVKIFSVLELFRQALALDGIISNKLDTQLEFLKYAINITTCSFTQYLDIFKGFTRAVADAVNDHFYNLHSLNLSNLDNRIGRENILKKFLPEGFDAATTNTPNTPAAVKMAKKLDQRVADIFFRDRIATSLGLQQLDLFLNRILNTLFRQSERLSQDELSALLNYDPKAAVCSIDAGQLFSNNIIYLGNKGLNLIKLKRLGIQVPEGFIITTEVFKCLDLIDNYIPASNNFKRLVTHMLTQLEKAEGKKFGDPENPLLLSVRSGSSISQPGMLDTFLNVGINEQIAEHLAKKSGNPWFAWDSYRRFIQAYGMVYGIQRDRFDDIIKRHKERVDIRFKRFFTGEQMREVAMAYKQLLLDQSIEIVESPMDQLFLSIKKVFASWNSKRAKSYRSIMGISNDWGTTATVQSMVFGNLSRESGSGVVFTHSPKLPGDAIRLWGDFTIGNQGEDVVSGLVKTLPISELQREMEGRGVKISLEKRFPLVYEKLKTIVLQLIYEEGWNPQEMEFAFQGPKGEDVFMLQARDLSLRDRKKVKQFDAGQDRLEKTRLGQGIGVSGGAMSGRIVFSLEEIDSFRRLDPDTSLILLRNDTVPDDILEIDAADGILTARGGLTSHAAVVAYNLDKTCVVGCKNLICNEEAGFCELNGVKMNTGDFISLDGHKGIVYQGQMKISNHLTSI